MGFGVEEMERKARPSLRRNSGTDFPLAIHLEIASHFERGFRDVLSA